MSTEYIWGCELNASNKEYEWDMLEESDNSISYNLLLKQATLGSSVPDKEVNIVALESVGVMANSVAQPLFRLKAGQTDQCQLDILITHPGSKLCLVEGSGPVYLWGQQLVELADEEGDEDVEDDDVESEEDDDDELKSELEYLNGDIAKHNKAESVSQLQKTAKRPASNNTERPRKVAKTEVHDEEKDDDEESEREEATPEKKKKRKSNTTKNRK